MQKSLICLVILSLLSCKKDEVSKPINTPPNIFIFSNCSEYTGCLDTATLSETINNCEDSESSNNNWCEIIPFGSFSLDETSKEFIPQFCNEVESKVIFYAESGDSITFIITCKQFYETRGTFANGQDCDDNRSKAYCINNEVARFKMESIEESIELEIHLTTIPDTRDTIIGNVGDRLSIYREGSPIEFFAIVNQRSLSYNIVENYQENHDNIELNGKTYYNVISNNISNWNSERFKYFYNKEYGLIGFTDTNSFTWTIEK